MMHRLGLIDLNQLMNWGKKISTMITNRQRYGKNGKNILAKSMAFFLPRLVKILEKSGIKDALKAPLQNPSKDTGDPNGKL